VFKSIKDACIALLIVGGACLIVVLIPILSTVLTGLLVVFILGLVLAVVYQAIRDKEDEEK